jgi:diguanylate cyclase (GGDEF)-like protein
VAVQVRLGLMAAEPALWLCCLSLAGITSFYVLVRSGLSRHLGSDPSLTLPQSVFGVLSERLAAEQLNQRQSGQAMSLVLIDIDHFKAVNDRHGHATGDATGDAVLRHFASTLHAALRASDFAGRWGGEELLVVTPQASADTAAALVDRLRAALAVASFDGVVPGLHITFSAGITECAPGEDLHVAIDRADRALYHAKETGRDRTVSTRAPLV